MKSRPKHVSLRLKSLEVFFENNSSLIFTSKDRSKVRLDWTDWTDWTEWSTVKRIIVSNFKSVAKVLIYL